MSENYPDRWVLIKTKKEGEEDLYKVFGTWYGGYLSGDAWRLNSGIDRVSSSKKKGFTFYGRNGSKYICHKGSYGTSAYTGLVLNSIAIQAEERGFEITLLTEQEALEWINLQ